MVSNSLKQRSLDIRQRPSNEDKQVSKLNSGFVTGKSPYSPEISNMSSSI